MRHPKINMYFTHRLSTLTIYGWTQNHLCSSEIQFNIIYSVILFRHFHSGSIRITKPKYILFSYFYFVIYGDGLSVGWNAAGVCGYIQIGCEVNKRPKRDWTAEPNIIAWWRRTIPSLFRLRYWRVWFIVHRYTKPIHFLTHIQTTHNTVNTHIIHFDQGRILVKNAISVSTKSADSNPIRWWTLRRKF